MSTSLRKTDAINKAVLRFCFDLAEHLGRKELADALAAEVGQIEARPPGLDGRATSWTDGRRQQVGERISAAWAAKREAKGLGDTFCQYKFKDEKPLVIKGKAALAEASGLSPRTIANKLSQAPNGFVVKLGPYKVVFARDDDAKDHLLQAAYLLSGNPDDLIELPSKKSRRF